MISNRLFYACLVALVLYVGLSSIFIMNPFIMLSQWLVILIIMNVWGTILKQSIKFGTWIAISGWVVALIIRQLVVLFIQIQKGAMGDYYSSMVTLRFNFREMIIGLLLIVPAIPTGYVCSWITKKLSQINWKRSESGI